MQIKDTVVLLGCKGTILAHVQVFIHQNTQVLLGRATLKELSQSVYISGITNAPHLAFSEPASSCVIHLMLLVTAIRS